MIEWISKNVGVIVAACAAAISLISLLVALKALKIQREHNYLSVKPIAHFSRGDYEDCIFVKLKNYGTGPLLVDSFTVQSAQSVHRRMIDALDSLAQEVTWDNFTDTIDGRALAPNKEFVLIKATFDKSQNAHRARIRSALAKMTLQLSYKDIYGKQHPSVIEPLIWFARH
jgi:hypothetical protein